MKMPSIMVGKQEIYYEEAGQGRPLLFVHSLGASGRIWAGQMAEFSRGFRVIAPDLRGHGRSPYREPVTLAAMAEDLAALLERLQAAPAHMVGISMGGVILQELYGRRPSLAASLTLCCTFSKMPPETAAERLAQREAFLAEHTMEEFAARYVADTLLPETPETIKDELRRIMGAMDKQAYLEATRACFTADTTRVPPTIAVPTLVIGAELDKGYPPESIRALAAKIPGARVAVIPKAAHLAQLDNPQAFNAALAAFLATV